MDQRDLAETVRMDYWYQNDSHESITTITSLVTTWLGGSAWPTCTAIDGEAETLWLDRIGLTPSDEVCSGNPGPRLGRRELHRAVGTDDIVSANVLGLRHEPNRRKGVPLHLDLIERALKVRRGTLLS